MACMEENSDCRKGFCIMGNAINLKAKVSSQYQKSKSSVQNKASLN